MQAFCSSKTAPTLKLNTLTKPGEGMRGGDSSFPTSKLDHIPIKC